MNLAIAAVKQGMPKAEAARRYGVPRVTLINKVSGKSPAVRKMGPEGFLSSSEESILVKWIRQSAAHGFPVSKNQLLDSVQHLICKLKRKVPFKGNRPGKFWFKLFTRRHPDISTRMSQN